MSSGPSRLVFNTLERLVSTDSNRAQAFGAAAGQAAWRARWNDLQANWRLYPGVSSQAQTVAAPLYGEVYSGLFVRPDAGSYLTVEPGLAMVVQPTLAGPDDNPYLFCDDPGVSAPGALAFATNATPSTVRWDVVECQPVDTLLESSSRDVYVPATGLFVPVVIDKVRAVRLSYRVRQGSPGGGFPGGASGWLPLAVVAVRDGATGFAQCDLYDVRPLVSERVLPQPPGATGVVGTRVLRDANYQQTFGAWVGFAESEFAGYLAGGALQRSTISSSLAAFGSKDNASGVDGGDCHVLDSNSPGNQAGGWALPSCAPLYVACLFPFTPGQPPLPRWARYSESADPVLGRRVPNGTRGLLCFTATPPGDNGLFNPLSFPADQQLGVSGVGPCVALGSTGAGSRLTATFARRRYEHSVEFAFGSVDATRWGVAASVAGLSSVSWNLLPGVHYPPGARVLHCSLALLVDSSSSLPSLNLFSLQDGVDCSLQSLPTNRTLSTGTGPNLVAFLDRIRVSRPTLRAPLGSDTTAVTPYPTVSNPPGAWSITLIKPSAFSGSVVTFQAACYLYIHGWEF